MLEFFSQVRLSIRKFRNKEPASVRSSSESAECLLAQRLPPILQKFNEEKANMRKHYHEIVSRREMAEKV